MKITYGTEYIQGINGNLMTVCIDAVAKSDDEALEILKRTLVYSIDTGMVDYRTILLAGLQAQAEQFKQDAEYIVTKTNEIINISVDLAEAMTK